MIHEARPLPPHRRRLVVPVVNAPLVTVRGYYSARFYEPDGATPALVDVHTKHGAVRRLHELAERPNLFTNTGMDQLQSLTPESIRAWLRIGTGSTPPAFTDGSLDTEVQASSTNGEGGDRTGVLTDAVWTHRSVIPKRVTMTADRNLTEFGFSNNSTASLSVRNLFRDELGDPITISLLSGKILEVKHTLDIAFPRYGLGSTMAYEERDAANNVTSTTTLDINAGFSSASPTLQDITDILRQGSSFAFGVYTSPLAALTPVPATATYLTGGALSSKPAYTTGSFQWTASGGTLAVTLGNTANFGFFAGYRNTLNNRWGGGIGWFFLDQTTGDAVSFTKLATHTLTFPTVRVSWARA